MNYITRRVAASIFTRFTTMAEYKTSEYDADGLCLKFCDNEPTNCGYKFHIDLRKAEATCTVLDAACGCQVRLEHKVFNTSRFCCTKTIEITEDADISNIQDVVLLEMVNMEVEAQKAREAAKSYINMMLNDKVEDDHNAYTTTPLTSMHFDSVKSGFNKADALSHFFADNLLHKGPIYDDDLVSVNVNKIAETLNYFMGVAIQNEPLQFTSEDVLGALDKVTSVDGKSGALWNYKSDVQNVVHIPFSFASLILAVEVHKTDFASK